MFLTAIVTVPYSYSLCNSNSILNKGMREDKCQGP